MDAADPSDELEQELRRDVREIFDNFDENKDDRLSWNEIVQLLQSLGRNPTSAEIKKYMGADTNGDNLIDFEEFWTIFRRQPTKEETEMELMEALKSVADEGGLDRERLKAIIVADPNNTEEEVDRVLEEFDTDKNGKLDAEEFARFLQDPYRQRP